MLIECILLGHMTEQRLHLSGLALIGMLFIARSALYLLHSGLVERVPHAWS